MKLVVIIILIILYSIQAIKSGNKEKCQLECSLIQRTNSCSCDKNCINDCCVITNIDCENFFKKCSCDESCEKNKNCCLSCRKLKFKKLEIEKLQHRVPLKPMARYGLTPQIKIKYKV